MSCETERVYLQPGSEAMDGALKSGDRLTLTLPGNVVVHAHVKEPSHEGSLLVTYGGVALSGGCVGTVPRYSARKNYYMQESGAGAGPPIPAADRSKPEYAPARLAPIHRPNGNTFRRRSSFPSATL